MKPLTRVSFLIPLLAWFGVQSCVTDNPAAYNGILGETRPPLNDTTSSGGTGSGGTTSTVATVSTTGVAGAAGASPGAGGEAADTTTTDGGMLTPFECFAEPNESYSPRCCEYETILGEEVKKGSQCSVADGDIEVCYRECGPAATGWKEERCTAGVYNEQNCVFPTGVDYSCYKIPEVIDLAACGLEGVTEPPEATAECDAPVCTLCNVDGHYKDTAGDAKDGWCLCREPDEFGVRRWTCASDVSWPCPLGEGC